VNRLVTVVTLAILLVGLILIGSSDRHISVADNSVPDDEIIASQTEASNSSASATITITMAGVLDE